MFLVIMILLEWSAIKAQDWNSILKNIQAIKKDCGEVCDTSEKIKLTSGPIFDVVEKHIKCDSLFSSKHIDVEGDIFFSTAPRKQDIPENILNLFTYNSHISVYDHYFNQAYFSRPKIIWSKELLQNFKELYTNGKNMNHGYGPEVTQMISDMMDNKMLDKIRNGVILVIGSESPWMETILLEKGAAKIITLEYANITVEHPNITIVSPQQLKILYNEQKGPVFDAVVSFSSLEHSGLGRYGEALNPWGDLITMAKTWCLTKMGGKFLIGVPSGLDKIIFNACRNYGRKLYSHLFSNWKILHSEYKDLPKGIKTNSRHVCKKYASSQILWCYQPLTLLQKDSC